MWVEPKFQIGDIVYLKHRGEERGRVFISEIYTTTCCSGTQILYKGRYHFTEFKKNGIAYQEHIFREVELDCVVEEQREMYEKRKES